MKRSSNPCREQKETISRLATGILTAEERGEVESHLSGCPGCRNYYAEVNAMTQLLASQANDLAGLKPSPTAMARWNAEILETDGHSSFIRAGHFERLIDWSRDIIWPYRRVWSGLTIVWLLLAVIDFSQRDPAESLASRSSHAPSELVRAYLKQQEFFSRLSRTNQSGGSNPVQTSSPSPRSEQHRASSRT